MKSSRYKRLDAPSVEPAADTRGSILAWTDEWLGSLALRDLLHAFGGPDPRTARLEDIVSFSAEHWDFRRGRERNLAEAGQFDTVLVEQILASAEALGLRSSLPPRQRAYDHVLVLGGMVRACILRAERAAQLVAAGINVREVTALSAFRSLGGDEHELSTAAGLADAKNEIDAMDFGVRQAFGLADPDEVEGCRDEASPNASWTARRYKSGPQLSVQVVAAPSTDPAARRANSADTYQFWAERRVSLSRHDRVLLITSTIYVPYQGLEAIRMLGVAYGCGVETIGVDTSQFAPPLQQVFTPANYLQEINSTIRAISAARNLGSP